MFKLKTDDTRITMYSINGRLKYPYFNVASKGYLFMNITEYYAYYIDQDSSKNKVGRLR